MHPKKSYFRGRKEAMKQITTVIFDIGNVLAGFDWRSYLAGFGFSEETKERLAAATFQGNNWKELDRGAKTDEEIYEDCLKEVPDLEKELSMVWEGRLGIVKEYEYAAAWIKELKARGYHVYILSNYGVNTFAEAKRSFSFLNYADGMVISYEIRHIKPEREIYEELVRRYDIEPEAAVFIDDLEVNVEAAEKMGFHTIHFTTEREVKEKLEKLLAKKLNLT